MRERLEKLREKLGVQWKDLAGLLDISVPMMGCLRRGERNPSSKLQLRIEALEKGQVALHEAGDNKENYWSGCPRCAKLEDELTEARAVIRDLAAALAAKPSPAAAPASGVHAGGRIDRNRCENKQNRSAS